MFAAASFSHYDPTLGTIILVVLAGAGLVWLGWISVQSLRQAILLRALPSGSAGVMDGQRVALHGQVRIEDPLDTLVNDDHYSTRIEWLPVPTMATVIGRLERRGAARVVVEDPELGLLLSPNAPGEAARIETLKGIGGLIGVAAGIVVILLLLGTR